MKFPKRSLYHILTVVKANTFQAISNIQMADGKAIVDITIPNTKAVMPGGFEYKHLLHPATLDACLHSLLAATAYANTEKKHVAIVNESICIHYHR